MTAVDALFAFFAWPVLFGIVWAVCASRRVSDRRMPELIVLRSQEPDTVAYAERRRGERR